MLMKPHSVFTNKLSLKFYNALFVCPDISNTQCWIDHSTIFFLFGIFVGSLANRSNWLFSLMVLFLVCISLTSASISTDSKLVQRINYGTIFKEDAKLILSKESWTHTFQIRLPVFGSI